MDKTLYAYGLLSDEDKAKVAQGPVRQTSDSHPIRVNYVDAAAMKGLPGKLGMTFAPGKKDPNGLTANHDRDLDKDLNVLRDVHGMRVLVTLMEKWELEKFGIGSIRERAAAQGISSLWLPVRDVDVPSSMHAHHSLVLEMLHELREGRSVVVHCRGGLGRTGVLVASVLVLLGHTPDEAIGLTRATRSGTIQTYEQERYVHQYGDYLKTL